MYTIMVNISKNILKIGRATGSIRSILHQYATGRDTPPDIRFIMIVDDPLGI